MEINELNLVQKAIEAQKNSYSPYSKFKVGAALLCDDGEIFCGVNVENAAYGATNCAERSAIFSAVTNGKRNFVAIAIVGGDLSDFCFPCGVCRQVLNEFNPEMKVVLGKKVGAEIQTISIYLKELLPYGFNQSDLNALLLNSGI